MTRVFTILPAAAFRKMSSQWTIRRLRFSILGSPDDRSDAAASWFRWREDNDRYGKLIIEEGGIRLC
ncbi:hypothetical protein GH714_034557 [Hevea brasiliensis]|uniref:Uncharacterized protein n=1 Tax=Hevea brasiliensis TaxID=3981 RepID=A0A6A6MK57_HEVBR|nr:hypothetical protein GH714_034557 [Hevea brasiliensis]